MMNAQAQWKELYRKAQMAKILKRNTEAWECLFSAMRYRREAALERKLAAAQRANEPRCYACGCRKSEHDSDGDERRPSYWCNGKNGKCDCVRFVDVAQELDNTLEALVAAQRTIEAQQQAAIKFSKQHYYGAECDPQVDPQDWHDFDVVFGI